MTQNFRGSDEIKMFPSLEMAAPVMSATSGSGMGSSRGSSSRRKSKNTAGGYVSKSVTKSAEYVEAHQLPGLLKTSKPNINPSSNGNDVSVLVGFNATNVYFDGEVPTYSNAVMDKSRTFSNQAPELSVTNLDEQAAPNTAGTNNNQEDNNNKIGPDHPVGTAKSDVVIEELRNYTTLMDKFSLHNFVIYHGETLKNTPEFQSFRRQYTHEWGSISTLIQKLETLLQEFHVKLAIINGPKLFTLGSLNLPMIEKEALLDCISNIDQVKPQLKSSITNADGDGEVTLDQQMRAVIKIQAVIRKFLAARRVRRIRLRLLGCIRIQAHLRKVLYRKFGMTRLKNEQKKNDDKWTSNQDRLKQLWVAHAEGFGKNDLPTSKYISFGSKKDNKKGAEAEDNRRLIIHIPSISAEEYMRLDMNPFKSIENIHISALYQLIDPDVTLLYVTPVAIGSDEQAYIDKFLSMLGISTLPKRLHFIQPEMIHRIPTHVPLSQVFWCSAAALRKVKMYVKRIPKASLIVGNVTWIERRISNILDIPIISTEPVVCETIKSRSYCKKIFMDSNLNVPIGAHDIYSPEDMFIALSRLIAANLDIGKWTLRLNYDYNNESTMILDVTKLDVVHALRSEQQALFEQNKGMTGSWYTRPVQLSVRKRIVAELKSRYRKCIKIARHDVYSWDTWLFQMNRIGIVIEAVPVESLGLLDAMCFIAPTGEVHMLSSAELICNEKTEVQSCIAPQQLIPNSALEGAIASVAGYMHEKWKMIGYVTVTFQAMWDALDELPRLAAIRMHFGMTPAIGAMGTTAVAISTGPIQMKHYIPLCIPNFDPIKVKGHEIGGKHCLYIPYMINSALKESRDDTFFKFCSMRGIMFDQREKVGVMFFFPDSIVSGVLSMLSIANSRYRVIEQAYNAVSAVIQQFDKDVADRDYAAMSNIYLSLKKALKVEEIRSGGV